MSILTGKNDPCPVQANVPLDEGRLAYLQDHTPFSQWKTPVELGEEFGYSPKQVIRIVTNDENHIAAILIDKRWFILRCSFVHHMDKRQK